MYPQALVQDLVEIVHRLSWIDWHIGTVQIFLLLLCSKDATIKKKRFAHRLNLLEAENQNLREMLLEDKDKEDVDLGVPSFRTNPEDGETAFVEVSARGMEDPEEDPTIQCQTVCQFVRPNAMSNEIVDEKEQSENQDGGLTAEEAEFTGEGMERR